MPFNIGATAAKKAFWGTTEVKKIFSGTTQVWASEYIDPYFYVTGFEGFDSCVVKKYLKSNFSYVSETPFTMRHALDLWADETHLYTTVLNSSAGIYIKKILKSNMSSVADTPILSYDAYAFFLDLDDTHIYAPVYDNANGYWKVNKILKSDMSVVATSSVELYVYTPIRIDETHIYVFSNFTVIKLLKSDLSFVAESANLGYIAGGSLIELVDDYIYINHTDGYKLQYLNKSNLAYVGQIALSLITNVSNMIVDETKLYVSSYNGNCIDVIRRSDLALLDSIVTTPPAAKISGDEDSLYYGYDSNLLYKYTKSTEATTQLVYDVNATYIYGITLGNDKK